jgi:hypothetical protein
VAESERETQNNPLEDVAAAASDNLQGKTVSISGSAARSINAGQVKMQASSAGRIQAHAVQMENSAAALVNAGSVETHGSAAAFTVGREIHLEDSFTPLLVAGKVKASRVRAVFLLAGEVRGDVHIIFTVWSALAVGFGFGAALLTLGKLFSRRPLVSKVAPRRK